MSSERTVYVPIAPGFCARVTVIEEAFPTPHEVCDFHAPTDDELQVIGEAIAARRFTNTPPFEILQAAPRA